MYKVIHAHGKGCLEGEGGGSLVVGMVLYGIN